MERSHGPRPSSARRARRWLLPLGSGRALAGAGLLALPSRATVLDACPADAPATLVGISRAIVPIGVPALRGFNVEHDDGIVATGVKLSAPPEYRAKQIAGNKAFVLRFTAPHAGPFDIQGTWSMKYTDPATGAPVSCTETATSPMNASKGTPLKLAYPKPQRFPGVKATQYDSPLLWSWKCTPNTDPTPLVATLRWEIDPRTLPDFYKGNGPFNFKRGSKTFTVTAADPCDSRQGGGIVKHLPKGAKLTVLMVGFVNVSGSSGGNLLIPSRAGSRTRPATSRSSTSASR